MPISFYLYEAIFSGKDKFLPLDLSQISNQRNFVVNKAIKLQYESEISFGSCVSSCDNVAILLTTQCRTKMQIGKGTKLSDIYRSQYL